MTLIRFQEITDKNISFIKLLLQLSNLKLNILDMLFSSGKNLLEENFQKSLKTVFLEPE